MGSLYETNMKLIKESIPRVYAKIVNIKTNDCKLVFSTDGAKNICKTINDNNMMIHSSEAPINQAKFLVNKVLEENKEIIFIFGFGLGYEINEFMKKDNSKTYFIVEPDINVFNVALNFIDLGSLLDKNVIMVVSDDKEDILESFKYMLDTRSTLSCRFVTLPSYHESYKALIDGLNIDISSLFKDLATDMLTTAAKQGKWLYNYICNLRNWEKAVSITALKNLMGEIPVVIVGAGPSLNYNLESLREINGKALVVAIGTAVKILLKNNISFDIAAAVDADEQAFNIGSLDEIKDKILLYSNQVDPTILERFCGPKFVFNQCSMDDYVLNYLGYEHYDMYSGPSVSNIIAYNLACLGCRTIIFLGQDMCYNDRVLYAKGAEKESILVNPNGYIRTKNINGEDVYSEIQFMAIKNSMEKIIRNFPNTVFYNGTRDGLNIEGAENIDFNIYLEHLSTIGTNCIKEIQDIYYKLLNETDRSAINRMIMETKAKNEEIIDICKEIVGNILEKNSLAIVDKKLKELIEIDFFNIILSKMLKYCDFIYSERETIDKKIQTYSFIAEKCLLMRTAFEDELGIK